MKKSLSRREYLSSFVKWSATLPLIGIALNQFAFANPNDKTKDAAKGGAAAGEKLYDKSELATAKNNPTAKALQYVANGNDAKLRNQEKQGTPAKEQVCSNCSFYLNPGVLKDSKEKVGQCIMFQNQLVHGDGWCTAWAKKA